LYKFFLVKLEYFFILIIMSKKNYKRNDPRIGKTLWDDLHNANLKTFKQDLKDIYDFYLDNRARQQLRKKGRVRRFFILSWWILKSLFFKLTPVRRILLVISIFLSFQSTQIDISDEQVINFNFNIIGFLLILIILLLELKDKLLARNELAVGRAVQSALMPDKSPEISGWDIWLYSSPANEIGGDIIDYINYDGTTWAFALGDVAGKGLGAALIAAKLQATLRAVGPLSDSLQRIVTETNKILYRDGIPERFVSLIYLHLQPDSNTIKFINAGHLPPVHIQNHRLKETTIANQALGLSEKGVFHQDSLKVNSGDCFFIYSDGLIETQNDREEFFGREKLFKVLSDTAPGSAQEMGKTVISAVEKFKGENRYRDDISLIILKRTI
ncbi:MAG: PP2C family protein-serine/threonine phosphatase, partial [bacterium]